jgi:hypothetical protein
MAIVYQHDKRSNITYAYESHSYWDKEKKTSRAKRTLIGRVDPHTGEITATDGRNRKVAKTEGSDDRDLEKLCAKLQRRCASLEALVVALKEEISELKAEH